MKTAEHKAENVLNTSNRMEDAILTGLSRPIAPIIGEGSVSITLMCTYRGKYQLKCRRPQVKASSLEAESTGDGNKHNNDYSGSDVESKMRVDGRRDVEGSGRVNRMTSNGNIDSTRVVAALLAGEAGEHERPSTKVDLCCPSYPYVEPEERYEVGYRQRCGRVKTASIIEITGHGPE